MYDKNYELLADAIIVQAAKDYRRSKSVSVRNEIKCFFLSEWFACLTNADGHKLFRKLEQERDGKKSIEERRFTMSVFRIEKNKKYIVRLL